jgi:hypothetical protein
MARTARFHFSRITKEGTLDTAGIVAAMEKSISIESRKFAWTIVDVELNSEVEYRNKVYPYVSGFLAKYDPDAVVKVINEKMRQVELLNEPNLERASSLFVYFPSEEMFVHHHVWNEVRPRDFRLHMAELIAGFHRKFFVDCELHAVSDYSQFVHKLAQLEEVTELRARVRPPNPLFSPFWGDLKDYLEKRRLRQLNIREVAKTGSAVPTQAPEIARQIEADDVVEETPALIGDAAVLMAADGYGVAEVTGVRKTRVVIVGTSDNALQMKLEADSSPADVASAGIREILRIQRSRRLKH